MTFIIIDTSTTQTSVNWNKQCIKFISFSITIIFVFNWIPDYLATLFLMPRHIVSNKMGSWPWIVSGIGFGRIHLRPISRCYPVFRLGTWSTRNFWLSAEKKFRGSPIHHAGPFISSKCLMIIQSAAEKRTIIKTTIINSNAIFT
jgi:hypothetical protein